MSQEPRPGMCVAPHAPWEQRLRGWCLSSPGGGGLFQVFKSSREIQERLVRAYELMLDFYGIRLEDRGTGTVGRAQNYQRRFQNLNWGDRESAGSTEKQAGVIESTATLMGDQGPCGPHLPSSSPPGDLGDSHPLGDVSASPVTPMCPGPTGHFHGDGVSPTLGPGRQMGRETGWSAGVWRPLCSWVGGPTHRPLLPRTSHRHNHNNLRITRILKSLGELGLEHYQAPLARFFLEETLVRRELPGVRQSALDYFMFAVRCRHQRRELVHFAWEHFRPRSKFVWGPRDKLRRFKPSCLPRLLEGPRKAEEEGNPRDPVHEARTQGRTCGPGHSKGGDRVDEGPQPLSVEPQDAGPLERSQGGEAGGHGEDGLDPPSPKESKKRKLEQSRREQPPAEPGTHTASEVEKIALNLEGCALSQGSLRTGTQEVGGQDPGEAMQPCPQPLEARVADKVRKRRKVDEGAGDGAAMARGGAQILDPTRSPAPLGCPETGHTENRVEEDTEGITGPKEGAPGSPSEGPGPSSAGPAGDEPAKAGEAAEVQDEESLVWTGVPVVAGTADVHPGFSGLARLPPHLAPAVLVGAQQRHSLPTLCPGMHRHAACSFSEPLKVGRSLSRPLLPVQAEWGLP
ncbi:hypothetical protein P7K49_010063 [Saguinus oedipus]|uniref:Opioid growth factor receptor (OGFr) conserved domain-containing protein n=1 Tax=Saguinus oedipus TaxID=9490 RepID=A0ABQ9VPZ2_SAGOE|nr:hypothetical protein P7K49_010063 [Saguinus oedipus]